MILANFQTEIAMFFGCISTFFVAVLMFLLAVARLVGRHMANDYRQKGGGTVLAKKVAAKGAVEIAKRLFWKRFG